MSGRTVAEIIGQTSDGNWPHDGRGLPAVPIIGWECPACGEWVNESGPRSPCPKDWRNSTPSVDVMLAWLRARGDSDRSGAIDLIEPADPEGWTAGIWVIDGVVQDVEYFTAPTLLAALEAAVRAVAGEDEQ